MSEAGTTGGVVSPLVAENSELRRQIAALKTFEAIVHPIDTLFEFSDPDSKWMSNRPSTESATAISDRHVP